MNSETQERLATAAGWLLILGLLIFFIFKAYQERATWHWN